MCKHCVAIPRNILLLPEHLSNCVHVRRRKGTLTEKLYYFLSSFMQEQFCLKWKELSFTFQAASTVWYHKHRCWCNSIISFLYFSYHFSKEWIGGNSLW